MTEKRFNLVKCKEHRWGIEENTLEKEDKLFFICREGQFETNGLVLLLNQLNDKNEQLKKDATTLIYANQDYRQQNQNLQKQLDYIQNSITNAIKHQKTELGQKALQEIIADYNEWMLGHKEAKEW